MKLSNGEDPKSVPETSRPQIKICCIRTAREARLAIQHGASALGLVSRMPSGPGVISEDAIIEIAATLQQEIAVFLLTCEVDADTLIEQQRRTRVNILQLVDRLPEGTHQTLRTALPGIGLVQVIHVTGQESVAEAAAVAPYVDAILLDSGNPDLTVKQLGGTGRVHNWQVSRQIRESIRRPVFLAGGLRPENVAEAIREVQPYGLDVCSGVRTRGRLDAAKLEAFFLAARCAM